MKKIFLLFYTDQWNSTESKRIIAATTSHDKAVKMINIYIGAENDDPLGEDDLDNLNRINQTQGREINYLIEEITVNQLI